jgi:hypothetical protein
MCTIIGDFDEGHVIEEYVLEEQELKPVQGGKKRKAEEMQEDIGDDMGEEYLVMVDEESQEEPKKKMDQKSIQGYLDKLPKGVTIKKEKK